MSQWRVLLLPFWLQACSGQEGVQKVTFLRVLLCAVPTWSGYNLSEVQIERALVETTLLLW